MKKTQPGPTAVAYSYIRFSSPQQAEGDSLRRQTEAAAAWCGKNGVRLDTSTTLHDLGKSAYLGEHRKNPDRNALAAFLKLVEQGRVPKGSYLVVESLDRLSREHIRPALTLLLNLIEAGVRVVQLIPAEQVYGEDVEPMVLMMAIMELSRGHSESKVKSQRVGDAWREKKRKARASGEVLTWRCPAWVERHGGGLRLVPDRAAVVRRIFELAAGGYGNAAVVKKLTADGVPAFGGREPYTDDEGRQRHRAKAGGPLGSGRWTRSNVANILRDRRALGEYQPRKRDGTPDGDPIPRYYPAAVSEDDWLAARAGARDRRQKPGRTGSHVNVFAGLLRNARDGDTYYVATRTDGHKPGRRGGTLRVLVNTNAAEGRAACCSFPFITFERAILSKLREVDPSEIVDRDDGPDESAVLAGELAGVDAELSEAATFMEANGFSTTIGKRVQALEARKRELVDRLADARQRKASPVGETWGEARSIMDALDEAADPTDARLRLRAVLRRVVDGVWCLFVGRGRTRLALVQVWFKGGGQRAYLIGHEPAKSNGKSVRSGRWGVEDTAYTDKAGPIDLRNPKHVARAVADLEAVDLEGIDFGAG